MKSVISRHIQRKSDQGVTVFGVDLKDAREEIFVRLVCDGITLGVAYAKAGFKSKAHDAPSTLFQLPRIQERANAILEARRTTGVVSLGEVTDMLQRVFAGAHAAEEYSAAHNAAFSLARLYGHVTDRATLEVIRRPSRDPDAPSEQALGDWVASLPTIGASGPSLMDQGPSQGLDQGREGHLAPLRGAPAAPLGASQPQGHNDFNHLQTMSQGPGLEIPGPEGPGPGFSSEINGLDWDVPGQPENGAPTGPVTVTPPPCGPSPLLENGAPRKEKEGTVYPRAEDLF